MNLHGIQAIGLNYLIGKTELVKADLKRAHAEGRMIVFQSCPISTAGGGHFSTNVDIAGAIERNLMAKWGERFFILNPSKYQMETKEGVGLMYQHAEAIRRETGRMIDVDQLSRNKSTNWRRLYAHVDKNNCGR